ncbi:hypothetical protein IF2G_07067 [Cordyceps javanica]|nr:hypothetical protein IF2G_07067 [Cordyceps javanica]
MNAFYGLEDPTGATASNAGDEPYRIEAMAAETRSSPIDQSISCANSRQNRQASGRSRRYASHCQSHAIYRAGGNDKGSTQSKTIPGDVHHSYDSRTIAFATPGVLLSFHEHRGNKLVRRQDSPAIPRFSILASLAS